MVTVTETRSERHAERILLADALKVSPGGSQTRSKAPGKVGPPDMREGFPLFAAHGTGPYMYGVDGKAYLDFAGANAAVPLGYARPEVKDAVYNVASSPLLSLPTQEESAASLALLALLPWAEQVRWVKTGSEAMSAAVRLARARTNGTVVLVAAHAYHGWHDWTKAAWLDEPPFDPGKWLGVGALRNGVPSCLTPLVRVFDYQTSQTITRPTLERVADDVRHRGQTIAAVIVEPHRFWANDEGQRDRLRRARDLATKLGAVLIFDEMVYGLRWAKGGGSEYFGVQPDLACYGKALGNGVPVACVAGRRDVMALADDAAISGTYGGDRLGLAAARAVLGIHEREDVIGKLWWNGRHFWDKVEQGLERRGMHLEGYPVHFRLVFRSDELRDKVLTRCAREGVLFHRDACNASAAMTEVEVDAAAQLLVESTLYEGGLK